LILKKGRKNNLARDLAIYLARELTGETGKSLGEYFGNISGAAITGRYNYLSRQIKQNRRIKAQAKRLRERIINN
jgi:chromosomal replication initiation ATPase DnaA